ncbi:MAG: phosphoribosylaminoimidazolesuccinocarboxamide synthase, partial [Cetobacterium sp.]
MKALEGKQMYEGKAKKVFSTDNPEEVIIFYKDDATAFNNVKKGQIVNKGILNNSITTLIYEHLSKHGIETHLLRTLSDRSQLCKKVEIVPLEVITRNVLAGSTAKLLGI